MSYSLADLRDHAKMLRGAKSLEEARKSSKEELGRQAEAALTVLEKLQEDLDKNSKYPSLLGEASWLNLKRIEDALSKTVAEQTLDEFTDPAKGRKRRLPKLVPLLNWNIHDGSWKVFVKFCNISGETFSIARGAWEDGYEGDCMYDETLAALEESRVEYNQSLAQEGSPVEEEELPSMEDMNIDQLFEVNEDQPSTSTGIQLEEETTTTTESKEIRVQRVNRRQQRKRQRRSSKDFDLDDESFSRLVDENKVNSGRASRQTKRKK